MKKTKIKDRFIISKKQIKNTSLLEYETLFGYLYVQQNTDIKLSRNENGKVLRFFCGFQFSNKSGVKNYNDLVCDDDVNNIIYYWSGRYILYNNGQIFNDCSGLFHVYYSMSFGIVSNDLDLMNSLGFFRIFHESLNAFQNSKDTMNWLPPPMTFLEDVFVMLPFEVLDFHSLRISFWKSSLINNIRSENIFEEFVEAGEITAKAITQVKDYDILLTLTGGHDSRVLFSFFRDIEPIIPIYLLDFKDISFSDLYFFKYYTKKRKYIYRWKNYFYYFMRKKRLNVFNKNCFFTCIERDRKFYTDGQLNFKENTIILRSNVLSEVFRLKNYNKFSEEVKSSDDFINELKKKYIFDTYKEEALKCYFDYRVNVDTLNKIKDWRRLFWLDQRSCGWVGYLDGAVSAANVTYINPFNSCYFFDMFELVAEKSNGKNDFQEDILSFWAPELNILPFNIPDSYFWSNRFVRLVNKFFIRLYLVWNSL